MATKTTTPKLTKTTLANGESAYRYDTDGLRVLITKEMGLGSDYVWEMSVLELVTTAGVQHTIGQRVLDQNLEYKLADVRRILEEMDKLAGTAMNGRLRKAIRAYQDGPRFAEYVELQDGTWVPNPNR